MSLECITSLVELEDCTTAATRFTINQTGLSPEQINELLDDSYPSVSSFVTAMKQFAAERLVSDVITMISPKSKSMSVIDNGKVGFIESNDTITASNYVGAYFDIPRTNDFIKFSLSRIGIFQDTTGDIDVLIYNLSTGELIDTQTISAVADTPTYINVEVELPTNRQRTQIGVFYDSTGINPYSTVSKAGSCFTCGNGFYVASRYLRYSGLEISAPFINSSVTTKSNTYGLVLDFALICDNESFLCTMRDILGLAYLYKVVEQIFEYSIKSGGQFSNQKVTNAANNEERYNLAQYNYQTELKKVLRTIQLPNGLCFSCNTSTEVKSILPG